MQPSVDWHNNSVRILDQSKLPHEELYLDLTTVEDVAEAIKTLRVRGAPAIGVAAAYGVALAAQLSEGLPKTERHATIRAAIAVLSATRPTAVNLFAALSRMQGCLAFAREESLTGELLEEAKRVHREEEQACAAISSLGASLMPEDSTVLTHCNAGMIATAAAGTALGAISEASRQGRVKRVIATETRPLQQGARLTVWELVKEGIPTTLITDSMVGHTMRTRGVDCVIVGADRIAANGDVANKIGTYGIALLAQAHGIPFYVAAPSSTIDLSISTGEKIVVETRADDEVTHIAGRRVAAAGCEVFNPAFDVTPNELVTAIITERGIIQTPYKEGLQNTVGTSGEGRK
jgi:methylthioribose-1-phosphate isomerase